jgi:hypothetical protein
MTNKCRNDPSSTTLCSNLILKFKHKLLVLQAQMPAHHLATLTRTQGSKSAKGGSIMLMTLMTLSATTSSCRTSDRTRGCYRHDSP